MKHPMYLDKKIINIVEKALTDPESEIYKAIKNEINKSDLGVPNGIATLDENGKITSSQIPDDINPIQWEPMS